MKKYHNIKSSQKIGLASLLMPILSIGCPRDLQSNIYCANKDN